MKNSENEKLGEIKSRLEDARRSNQEIIDGIVDDIKTTYGIGLTDEQFAEIWQDKINKGIELYRKDADKSYISEEEKQKAIDSIKARYAKKYQDILAQRKKYLAMTEEEIRQEFISEGREDFNKSLIETATNRQHKASELSSDWAHEKETRTLVGEIKYVEFMSLDQKNRRDYIKKELSNFRSKLFESLGHGVGYGLLAGFVVAIGHEIALNGNNKMFLMQMFSSTAVTALLSTIISAMKHSKAYSLIKKMRERLNVEYKGEFDDVLRAAYDSHTESEERALRDSKNWSPDKDIAHSLAHETYLGNLDLVNVAQDYATTEAAKRK